MTAGYNITPQPSGKYASKLEAVWAEQFARWGWYAEYIGDWCQFADFDVRGVRIEVKPTGEQFVMDAATRSNGNILIVEGSPICCRWWFVDYVCTAILMDIRPRQTPYPAKFGQPARMETVDEFMSRQGYRFR